MKKKYIVWIFVTLIIVDLFLWLYPTVSDYVNSKTQSQAVAGYEESLADMDDERTQLLLKEAREYNQRLLSKENRFAFTSDETDEYKRTLGMSRGIIGILTIDKIDVKLPIYHGTDEGVLQVGLGHIPGTSLPVGGEGTHAFITGHTGLPSSTLFTNLNRLTEGDEFSLYVLGETLRYRVDNIQKVRPNEARALNIDPQKDYCTLVTCYPYGINNKRLLVRGHRVAETTSTIIAAERAALAGNAQQVDKGSVILIFTIPVLPILIVYIALKCRRIQTGGIAQ